MESAYHIPVMLRECIDGLNINPHGIYVDVTFGGGGHSKEICSKLSSGKLIAFDQDDEAQKNVFESNKLIFVKGNFRYISNYLRYLKIEKVDGILADLGVSSNHFDKPERGFSFMSDAKLDMRMNQKGKLTAEYVINKYPKEKLVKLFREFGEIANAYKLAEVITNRRTEMEIKTIAEFLEVIKPCTPKINDYKYLATVFQALRIEVNQEIEALSEFLLQTADLLLNNGRLVIISYHSLEDRIVKNYIKYGNLEGQIQKDFYGNLIAPLLPVNKKIIIPDDSEIERNTRARSAKLRIAEKK